MFLSILFYAAEDPPSAKLAINALLASWALGLSLDERPEELS